MIQHLLATTPETSHDAAPPASLTIPDADRSSSPKLSIVIPVYNESPHVDGVIQHIANCCQADSENIELVIVNDGSTDDSARRIEHIQFHRLRILHNPVRKGCGSARRLGTAQAAGHYVAWIDADGTYDPEDLLRLARELEVADADQIIGVRSCDHGRLRILRWTVKRALCVLVSVLWRRSIPDLNCALRVFRRTSAAEFLPDLPDGFSCSSTATLSALNRRHRLLFSPITYSPRCAGSASKFHPLFDGWRLLRVIARMLVTARKTTAACRTGDVAGSVSGLVVPDDRA